MGLGVSYLRVAQWLSLTAGDGPNREENPQKMTGRLKAQPPCSEKLTLGERTLFKLLLAHGKFPVDCEGLRIVILCLRFVEVWWRGHDSAAKARDQLWV